MSVANSSPPVDAPASPPRPSPARLALSIAGALALALALGGLLTYCGRDGAKNPHARGGFAGGRPPTTVGVATAALGEIPIDQTALGTVTPVATIQVNARVSGQLMRVGFKEGQMVRKGQLLMLIDPRPYQAALDLARATLAHDKALLAGAQVDLRRYQGLKSQDSIAVQTYDDQKALVAQDQAQVAADQANVDTARLNLEYTRVTAPVAGRAGLRQIDLGNQVVANESTPVTVITQISPITVVFPLPEDIIPQVMAQHGGEGLPVTVSDRSGAQVLGQGKLLTLDNAVNTTTGTVNGRAQFANADGALFPFQFVNVTLHVNRLKSQVVVPTTAVRHGPQGDYVWLLNPDKTVRHVGVTVGPGTSETVSIASGLAPGQVVITDGGDRLRDGARVVLPGQATAGGRGRWDRGGHRRSNGSSQAAG